MLESYQNLPLKIDPIAIAVGSFSIGWYSIMYLVAFAVIFGLLSYRIEKKEALYGREMIFDFLLFALVGALLGGRLGYVFLYNLPYYLQNFWEIFSPYDFSSRQWIGIYGMSYHGGLLGVLGATLIFVRINREKTGGFWKFMDFVVPAVPAGYLFGRVGNFLNGELYGRVTDNPSGMYFFSSAGEIALRYPSQLIEAFLEGLVLFAILWTIRNRQKFGGYFASLYLIGYGVARIIGEFFREPDEHIGYIFSYLTLGQIFSLMMIFAGINIYFQRKKNNAIIERKKK